jgi:predicted enzyme related to lactoylglutathione lyase
MKRVTGIGGIFFKSEDPKKLKAWYGQHLDLKITDWGSTFYWIDPNDPAAKVPARTEWSPFKNDTTYFSPSEKPFMFNYRVENLVELLKVLGDEGVTVVGAMEEYPYGKFGWIMDPEGNKIELWEPKDGGF